MIIYIHWDSELNQSATKSKVLHNPKRLVSKVCKKYKIIEIDMITTPTKGLLNSGKSWRKKATFFTVKLRQAKPPALEILRFSFVGFLVCPRRELIRVDFENQPYILIKRNLNTSHSHFFSVWGHENLFSFLFFRSFYKPPWKSGGEEISLTLDLGVLDP